MKPFRSQGGSPLSAIALALAGAALLTDAAPPPRAESLEAAYLAQNEAAMTTMVNGMSMRPTGDVDRDPEVHLRPYNAERLAVLFGVSVVEARKIVERFDDCPSQQVRVRDLAFSDEGAVLIDDPAVLIHHFYGDGALRSRERDCHAGGHIFGDLSGDPAHGLKLLSGSVIQRWSGSRCGRGG